MRVTIGEECAAAAVTAAVDGVEGTDTISSASENQAFIKTTREKGEGSAFAAEVVRYENSLPKQSA